jgi:hypothetical protein
MLNINFGSRRRWSSRVLRVKGGKQEGRNGGKEQKHEKQQQGILRTSGGQKAVAGYLNLPNFNANR